MPDGEFRKLQVTGGSTMIVSLPKSWVRGNQLGKGDIVSIEELATGDLRISPMQGERQQDVRQHRLLHVERRVGGPAHRRLPHRHEHH